MYKTINHIIYPVGIEVPTRFDIIELTISLDKYGQTAENRKFLTYKTTLEQAQEYILSVSRKVITLD